MHNLYNVHKTFTFHEPVLPLLNRSPSLVVEQADTGKGHHHAVLVAGFNNLVIPHRSPRLSHIDHGALFRPINIVPKGEEGVRS